MIYKNTDSTKKIFAMKKRIRAVQGGTSASKTISILIWLIDYAQSSENKKIDVVSESYPHLKDGAIKDFKSIMVGHGYWKDARWNKSDHVYTFETGSIIKFLSIDKIGKAHGARRDVLFINEANFIDYSIYEQLEVRTKDVIWLDWNPSSEFWYYTEIKGKVDHDFVILTYKDCIEVLPPSIVQSIEAKKYRKNWWKVYGLGQLGDIEGRIYTGWTILEELPKYVRLERIGLDFGYTNDPTAIVGIYPYEGGYIVDEILYRTKMRNSDIAGILKQYGDVLVIADSAEPKSIDEIKLAGVNIVGATKGKGSILQGIQNVQDQKMFVTQRSVKVIKEYRNYLWETNRKGKPLNTPVGVWNHTMDAIRYALDTFAKKKELHLPDPDVLAQSGATPEGGVDW